MATNKELNIVKGSDPCPFCKAKPRAMVMPAHLGFCCYVGCENQKCLVNPRTGMYDGKTQTAATKKAKLAWDNKKKK